MLPGSLRALSEQDNDAETTQTPIWEGDCADGCLFWFQVDDTVNTGTQDLTVELYGSFDGGTTWEKLYFCKGTSNIYDPTVNPGTNSAAQTKDTAVCYMCAHPYKRMRVSALRADTDTTEIRTRAFIRI